MHRWIAAVADVAGLVLDVGDRVNLVVMIGDFDLPLLVVDADIDDVVLLGNVVDDLFDVVPGVEHHGIMGAQADGVAQPLSACGDVAHHLLLHVSKIEESPHREGQKQQHADAGQKFEQQALVNDGFQ